MVVLLLVALLLVLALVVYFFGIDSLASAQRALSHVLNRRDHHVLSNLFQVDEKSKRHGGELVASVLKAHNVTEVFTLCGGHISPILVACESLGIRVIDTRHEVTAVFAADAVARLKQSIGVAAVTAGPGLTNTITAVKNAQMAESPLLLLGGAAPSLLKDRGALQDIDQLVLFRPLCKYTARIYRVRDIVPILREAIRTAQSGTPGPVFVEFPIDTLYPYEIVAREIGFVANARNFKQKAVNAYLMTHISRQFGGAWLDRPLTPLPVDIPYPRMEDVTRLTRLLANSRRPVILLGSQAMLPPVRPARLQFTVMQLGIPAYLGGMSRGLLGADSELQMRQNRKEALKEADLVILAGTVCDFRLSYGRVLSSKAKIVSINRNRAQLTKNHGIFWKADLLINADVASTLVAVSDALPAESLVETGKDRIAWLATLREREIAKEKANAKKAEETLADGHLNPLKVLTMLDKVLPEDTILVADGGDFVGSAAYIVRPRGPLQWLDPGAFGTLGVGGGFALGAKAVHPTKPVLILYGDGSCGYSIVEFDSYHRHKLPVMAVVGNDACWSQIAREQIPTFKSNVGTELARCAYESVAEAFGAIGTQLSKTDEAVLSKRFDDAIRRSRDEARSLLVNVLIGKTDFREGSISV